LLIDMDKAKVDIPIEQPGHDKIDPEKPRFPAWTVNYEMVTDMVSINGRWMVLEYLDDGDGPLVDL